MICGGAILPDSEFEPDVGALEDKSSDVDAIIAELHIFAENIRVARSYQDFVALVRAEGFDAVSIDWYIGEHQKGREALELVRRVQPDAATVVFTRDPDRLVEASRMADFVLAKGRGNMEIYRRMMVDAARVGRFRRIVSALRSSGLADLEGVSCSSGSLDRRVEFYVRDTAREVLANSMVADQHYPVLRELLRTRGWWRTFDSGQYMGMATWEKLKLLAEYARISNDTLAQILAISEGLLERILLDSGHPGGDSSSNVARSNELLSVIAYLFRLCQYEPEMLGHLWRVQRLFKESVAPPPWDAHGMERYLLIGPSSLSEALEWIRSH
jgi:hypothetical protein